MLYGIFPCMLAGAAASYARMRWSHRPLPTFVVARQQPGIENRLREVYRFASTEQVEVLARVARKWDLDGVPDPEASELGEFIIKVGLGVLGCGIAACLSPSLQTETAKQGMRLALPLTHMTVACPRSQCGLSRFPNSPDMLTM